MLFTDLVLLRSQVSENGSYKQLCIVTV